MAQPHDAIPFLRWAGSKRWLIPILQNMVPENFGSYYEPFLGSGACYFTFAEGHTAYLSDVIPNLIDCYRQVRDRPTRVAQTALSWGIDEASYYEVRGRLGDMGKLDSAAAFIYLNKLCFNGLYRENGRGKFNVPYGRSKIRHVADIGQLRLVSKRLKTSTRLSICDFDRALEKCVPGDLVYLDPPYVAGHRTNGFADYNAKIFSWADQQRLAETFRRLDEMGVFVIQSNADHSTVRELYSDYSVASVSRYSSMSATAKSRGASGEILITGKSLLTHGDNQ